MRTIYVAFLLGVLSSTLLVPSHFVNAQDESDRQARLKAIRTFVQLIETSKTDLQDSTSLFVDNSKDELIKQVKEIREKVADAGNVEINVKSETDVEVNFTVGGKLVPVLFSLTEKQPYQVKSVSIGELDDSETQSESMPNRNWDDLVEYCDAFGESGFSGAILVVRDGEPFYQRTFGMANREKEIPNANDTVFAIGSAPIDFTHAGILLLRDREKLKLDDPITKFFEKVPEDKQSITIQHLMTGQSGLPDFHDIPSDPNPDHFWIDREEAVRRIMAQDLLFEPGTSEKHSHSAWGLLAAIIEVVSEQTYPEFTTSELFKPAGMTSTGFFGDPQFEDRQAIGYGLRKSSDPNSPANWGPTSWLVMGSGGQVSTLNDMWRWSQALKSGKILSEESEADYWSSHDGVSADGDMFGFEFMHSHDPNQLFMVISNAVDSQSSRREFSQFAEGLHRIVTPRNVRGRYSLGVLLGVTDEGRIEITELVSGGAAEQSGLKSGDVLTSVNGTELDENVGDVLQKLLQSGEPMTFEVIRANGSTESVKVTPKENK